MKSTFIIRPLRRQVAKVVLLAFAAAIFALMGAPAVHASVFENGMRWPQNFAGYTVINVCIVNGSTTEQSGWTLAATPSLDTVIAHVRSALAGSWEAHSSVRFAGWMSCDDVSNTADYVGLYIHPDAPNLSTVGIDAKGQTSLTWSATDNAKIAGVNFKPWGYNCKTFFGYDFACVEQYAIHEFGHVIGFVEEWEHPQVPAECSKKNPIPNGSYAATYISSNSYTVVRSTYDWDSIMNYGDDCADVTGVRFGSTNLSPTDIAGVSELYPAPTGATNWLKSFGYTAGTWRVSSHPRMVADVDGDGDDDVIGFGNTGAYVSLSTGTGFTWPQKWSNWFGNKSAAGSYTLPHYPRTVADVNGDNKADIVAFADSGVLVALSDGSQFGPERPWWSRSYGYADAAGGWRGDKHPRVLADVNNDGMADIVGFYDDYVYVSLSTGSGFAAPQKWSTQFTANTGWNMTDHVRTVADVTGDGRADIVGFGSSSVYVAESTGTSFKTAEIWRSSGFTINSGGWLVNKHPRLVADVDGDDKADIVGFASGKVYVALSEGDSFGDAQTWTTEFTTSWSTTKHMRTVGDVTGDGQVDIVGFADAGVMVLPSH